MSPKTDEGKLNKTQLSAGAQALWLMTTMLVRRATEYGSRSSNGKRAEPHTAERNAYQAYAEAARFRSR